MLSEIDQQVSSGEIEEVYGRLKFKNGQSQQIINVPEKADGQIDRVKIVAPPGNQLDYH